LVVISDLDQIDRFIVERSESFDRLAARFWPGPLTLIGKAIKRLPIEVTAGTGTVGLRLPNDDAVRLLVRGCGGALTATSANPAGSAPAKNAVEVERYFGSSVDLIVEGGEALTDRPSTVVDATRLEPRLLREGILAWSNIQTEFATD